jgi:hypothetical protein
MKMLNEASPLGLWGSVSEVTKAFSGRNLGGAKSPSITEIAIAASSRLLRPWLNAFQGTLHPERDAELKLQFLEFGYDVADQYLLSGLSNCGYSKAEIDELRRNFAGLLNSHGLFNNAGEAEEYAEICAGMVPEHAPFFAYRIRRVTTH